MKQVEPGERLLDFEENDQIKFANIERDTVKTLDDFDVTYNSLEKPRNGKLTPIPPNKAHAKLYSTLEFNATNTLMAIFAEIAV